MSDFDQPGQIVVQRPEQAPVLVSSILSDDEIGRVWRISKSLAASGLFKDVTQAEQAFGRILLGRDLGLSPTQSLMGIDVVRGNVQIRSVLLASWVRKHPDYDYSVLEHDEQHCVIQFSYKGNVEGISAFTIEDAKAAKLVKPDSAWSSHPRNMLWARAMSNGVRWFCPDLTGGMPVYTEADSFEDHKAIGDGEGDGSEPGWQGVSSQQEKALEAMIASAIEKGHAGLSDRATVQMRVAGQTPAFVDQQLQVWAKELAEFEPIPEAEVVPEPEPEEGEQGTLA